MRNDPPGAWWSQLPLLLLIFALPLRAGWAEVVDLKMSLDSKSRDLCPDPKQLKDQVRTLLKRDPFGRSPRRFQIKLRQQGRGFEALIEFYAEEELQGERLLRTPLPDCKALISVVALDIALALDPLKVTLLPPPSYSVERVAPKREPQTSEPPKSSPAAPKEQGAKSFGLSFNGGVNWGTTPQPGTSFGFQGDLYHDALSLALELRYDLPRTTWRFGGRVRGELLTGALLFCRSQARLGLCGALWLGQHRGSGVGFVEDHQTRSFYSAGGLRGSWGDEDLRLYLDLQLPLSRLSLLVDGEEVWRSPPLQALLGVRFLRLF